MSCLSFQYNYLFEKAVWSNGYQLEYRSDGLDWFGTCTAHVLHTTQLDILTWASCRSFSLDRLLILGRGLPLLCRPILILTSLFCSEQLDGLVHCTLCHCTTVSAHRHPNDTTTAQLDNLHSNRFYSIAPFDACTRRISI